MSSAVPGNFGAIGNLIGEKSAWGPAGGETGNMPKRGRWRKG
jgi:hypothetical protein